MKAIILAAGLGRRMRSYTKNLPKCLIDIGGRPLLGRQIDVIRKCGIKDILVVSGFQADKVVRYCRRFNGTKTLVNSFYRTTNSIISLWLSRHLWGTDLIIVNSDILFEPIVLRKVIDSRSRVCVLVNKHKDGYRVRLKNGYVLDMRMDIPTRLAFGTYGGVTKIGKSRLGLFEKTVQHWIERGRLNDWYEDAVVGMIKKGVRVGVVSSDGYLWYEVDTPQDLKKVRIAVKRPGGRLK